MFFPLQWHQACNLQLLFGGRIGACAHSKSSPWVGTAPRPPLTGTWNGRTHPLPPSLDARQVWPPRSFDPDLGFSAGEDVRSEGVGALLGPPEGGLGLHDLCTLESKKCRKLEPFHLGCADGAPLEAAAGPADEETLLSGSDSLVEATELLAVKR